MREYVYFQNDVCFIADDENGDYGDCIDIDLFTLYEMECISEKE